MQFHRLNSFLINLNMKFLYNGFQLLPLTIKLQLYFPVDFLLNSNIICLILSILLLMKDAKSKVKKFYILFTSQPIYPILF